MKIVSATDQQIIVKDNNYVMAIIGGSFFIGGVAGLAYVGLNYQNLSTNQMIVPVVFLGVGFVITAVTTFVTVTFDKTTNKINWRSRSLFGKKLVDYQIDQIKRVEVRDGYQMMNTSSNSNNYNMQPQLTRRLFLITKDGQEINFGNQSSSTSVISVNGFPLMRGPSSEIKVGQQLATFLKVPFQEVSPNLSQSVSTPPPPQVLS